MQDNRQIPTATTAAGTSPWLRRLTALLAVPAVAAGVVVALPQAAPAATPPTGSAGAVDTAFGSNGIAAVAVSGLSLRSVTKTIVQPDGRILVAGLQPGTTGSVVVARLTSSGALDTSFGGGKGYVKPGLGSTSTTDLATIALQPDGKILVGGSVQSGTTALAALARLTVAGAADTTFGTNGKVTTTVTGSPLVHISDLALLSTGQIVASTWAGSSSNLTLLRYTAAGSLDKSFGSSGIATVTTSGGVVEGNAVAVTADGHLVEAGYAKQSGQLDTAVARFNANGSPDLTWPSSGAKTGAVVMDVSGAGIDDQANDVTVDGAGNLVLSGSISSSPSQSYVQRMSAGGVVDRGFGGSGVVKGTFDGAVGTGGQIATSGRELLLVGGTAAAGTTTNALGVARLTSTGDYDSGFGVQGSGNATGTGRESVPCASSSAGAGTGVAVQQNGQIVVAGWCNNSLVALRLNAGNLSNLSMTTTTPSVPAGHGDIPLASVPGSSLLTQAGALAAAPGFGTPGFGTPGFGTPGFGTPGFGTPGFGTPGFGTPGFGTPGFGTPVDASPLVDTYLGQIPLSALPLTPSSDGPATWQQVLEGTVYDGLPLQSVTLQQVLSLPAPNPLDEVTLGQLDVSATALRRASVAAFLLGTTPTASLPAPTGGFCDYLAAQPVNCRTTSSSAIAAASLLDLELQGDSFATYFQSTPIELVGLAVVNSPLTYVPLNDIDMRATTLGATKTTQLTHPDTFVTCQPTTTQGQCDTLASAQAAKAIQPSTTVTLARLLTDSPAAVGHLALADLALGLVSSQNLPVEQFDSDGMKAVYAASPLPSSGAAYRVEFDLGCGAAAGLVVTPALPAGFRVIPRTVSMTIGSGATASNVPVTVAPDGSIRPSGPVSCAGTQHTTVNLQAEPGTDLGGPFTSGVTVAVATDTLSVSDKAPVTVADNFERDDDANPANSATFDNLYIGHIAHAGDLDYFSLPAPPAGSTLTVTLSHQPADYDLVVYGPAAQMLRATPGFGTPGFGTPGFGTPGFGTPGFGTPGFGTPGFGTPGFGTAVGDSASQFASDGTATPPSLDADVPRLNLPLRGFSTQRDRTVETVTTKVTDSDTTPFLLQVSGYNGASSDHPYVLRVSVTPPPGVLPCAAASPAFAGSGTTTLTMPTSPLPVTTQTLVLVNQKRFGDYYGAEASQTIATELQKLAASSAVNGVVVPVELDEDTAAAFAAWDDAPCSSAAANDVVASVNALVDRLRAGLKDLRYVVIAGADQLFPMARVQDKTAVFNESGYSASTLRASDNPESRAAKDGYLLSDNPYGDLAPQPYLDSQLYVPQLAVGRLVETPQEIAATIDACVATGCRTTPDAAFVTGYSPFDKGSRDVADTLAKRVPTTALIDATPGWTRQDAASGMAAAAHGYLNVNAHFDNYRALPEQEFLSGDESDPLSTADLPADLSGGVSWTIGCHAGLNLPDIYLASPTAAERARLNDWAQATLHAGSTAFAGNSGYGLGDTDAIAYSERLSSLFARNLDGSMTVGQALAFAKQQYTQLGTPSVYDAKAIEEMNFFGLPMWRLGSAGRSAAVALPANAPAPSTVQRSAYTTTVTPKFSAAIETGRGTYYTADGQEPQVTPNEPIQPRTSVLLPERTDGLVAKGAIIEGLTSHDIDGTDPEYATVVADKAAFNPEPRVSTAAYPSQLQSVAGLVTASGRRDALVLVPGQFISDGTAAGVGKQRLFDSVTATVLSSNSSSTAPPRITNVTSAIQGTSATVTVKTADTDVVRGVALVLLASGGTSQTWRHVELVNSGNGIWVGTATVPAGTTVGSYFAQLADDAGNVAVSSDKGRDWDLIKGNAFSFSLSGNPDAHGLYPDPTTVTITPPAGVTSYTVTLDGTTTTYTGTATITISGNGGHVLTASAGGFAGSIGIPIDAHPPVFTVDTPTDGGRYGRNATVTTRFSCAPNGITVSSCTAPETLDTTTSGAHTFTVTAVDAFGLVWTKSVQYTVVGQPPTAAITRAPADKTTNTADQVSWQISDPDDAITSLKLTCTLDGQATACGSADTAGRGTTAVSVLPGDTAHTFTLTVTDPDGATASASATPWRVFYQTTTKPDPVVPNVPLSAVVTYIDAAGASHPLVSSATTGEYTVQFFARGGSTAICTVTRSDANGRYTCDSVAPTATALASLGVTAKLVEKAPFAASSGSNGLA